MRIGESVDLGAGDRQPAEMRSAMPVPWIPRNPSECGATAYARSADSAGMGATTREDTADVESAHRTDILEKE
jgi:hypothetical protein